VAATVSEYHNAGTAFGADSFLNIVGKR